MFHRRNIFKGMLFATALSLVPSFAQAQIPDGPLRILVGVAPGGTFDTVARLLAERLSRNIGQPVIVENRPGAAGLVALLELRNAAADGRTLLVGTNSAFTIFPHTYSRLEYSADEFQPVAGVARFAVAVASGPALPAQTIEEFVEWAQEQPDGVSFGMPGAGTTAHFAGVMLGQDIGVEMEDIPYAGGAPAVADLMGGHIPLVVDAPTAIVEQYRAGTINVLATTGRERTPVLPDVPTLLESGIDVHVEVAISAYGPAGIPDDVAEALNAAITEVVNTEEFAERLEYFATVPDPATGEELLARQEEELANWEAPIRESGFRAD